MKRSYQETNTSDDTTSSVGIGEIIMKTPRPVLIEVEEHDTASRNNSSSSSSSKRQRKIAGASLNLLIRVMEEASALKDDLASVSSKSQGEGMKKIMIDRVPSDDYNRSFSSSSSSCSSSLSSSSVPASSAAACGEGEDVVIATSTVSTTNNASVTTVTPNSSTTAYPSLPCGRPLMAPPRFPTQFLPVQPSTTTQSKTAPLTTTGVNIIINNNNNNNNKNYTLKPLSVKLLPKQQVKYL
jgi:hypothetical protein